MKYLITGCGTFANAYIDRLLKDKATKLIRVFSRGEKAQWETKNRFKDNRLEFIIGDIRDYKILEKSIRGVDIVVHSAAMKHIDKCEQFPLEAIKTNVNGSKNVILACINNKVKKLVCLSTDKATNAESCYGSTKYLMEKMCLNIDSEDTDVVITRYGNILGSNGSVVCLFKELAKQGKELPITNPDMTRFFMTIEQAIKLVEYAVLYGRDKEIIVAKNKAATIKEIADVISDKQVVIGTRCNEKTGEALLTINELNRSKDKGSVYIVHNDYISDFKYEEAYTSYTAQKFTKKELEALIGVL